jgi:hypothetical protein
MHYKHRPLVNTQQPADLGAMASSLTGSCPLTIGRAHQARWGWSRGVARLRQTMPR